MATEPTPGARGSSERAEGRHLHAVPDAQLDVVGKPWRKIDSRARVTGQTRYADDLAPRMSFCKLLRSTQAHARIVRIDTSAAEAMEGVHAPSARTCRSHSASCRSARTHTRSASRRCVSSAIPWLPSPRSTRRRRGRPAVASSSSTSPCRSCRKVFAASEPAEHRIHDYGRTGNFHRQENLEFGDLAQGFAESDVVREDFFYFEGNTHLPMEEHATLATFDPDGKLCVQSSTQTPHYLHRALSKVLAEHVPPHKIRVIACPNGGGFG